MSVTDEYSNVNFYEDDYETYYNDETLVDVWNNCVILSIYSILPTVANVVVLNFIFGCLLGTRLFPKICIHLVSAVIGIYLINTLESPQGKLILVWCFVGSFLILHICHFMKKLLNMSTANFVKIMFITLLVLCEYYFVQPETWLQIRGIVMVLVMKVISLADDVETLNYLPNFAEYFGYTLCGANVLFGPWIPFSEYQNLCEKPPKRNIYWICSIIKLLAASLFCLTLSNCWANYFIGNEANRWIKAYQEAFSFRTSHYFVCYLSEVAMVSFGFSNAAKKANNKWSYTITEPMEIEFPSSLSIVVRKWNQPMHDFLKKYIYRSWLDHGRFVAIFVTFLVSSFLHGLELKVSVVLVTIGIFSYLQVAPRNKVSEMFDSCLKIRPCKDCKHKYKRSDFRVKIVLFMYSLATILHLAYLGILMDPSTEEIGIYEKWQNLYFLSHIVMFFNLLLIL